MRNKRIKIDTVMLTVALFCVCGACLAYNLHTSEGGNISASLNDLASGNPPRKHSAVSVAATAHIEALYDTAVSALPDEPLRSYELLPPLIVNPE